MKKTEKNLTFMNCLFVTTLIVANVVSCKIVTFWVFTVPAAIVAYPITFLITDIIGELWGKKEANRTVWIGFICQAVTSMLIVAAYFLPIAPYADNNAEFKAILLGTLRTTAASMIAYLCSQSWDVFFFHFIRDRYYKKHGTIKGGKWLWNNGSTMTSQIIDTVIFIVIAFYGKVPNIVGMCLSQYAIKWIFAAVDTLPFYLLTKRSKYETEAIKE